MHSALRMAEAAGVRSRKKLDSVQPEASSCTGIISKRLCIRDKKSGLKFLVDTGANVSVLPVSKYNHFASDCSEYKLYAANGSVIKTFGTKTMILDFCLRRPYKWTFIIAEVTQPILGADFLAHHGLIVDLSSSRLIDDLTKLKSIASIVEVDQPTVTTVEDTHPFHDLLCKYVNITKPASYKEVPTHGVFHHIETTGPPVYARARPLPPSRYKKVQEEFRFMQETGICRPSKSPWASPLHVVPKKNGELRPCGDYRKLNSITKPDRYPIPRLSDFTYILTGKKVFSKIDINRAYHCISTAPEDIEKTAIITPFGLFEFPRMTFGLRNAAQTFQRFMHHTVFQDLDVDCKNSIFSYIDDVILASPDEATHRKHLESLFKQFERYNLTINMTKCVFGKAEIDFLGYHVTSDGIRPLDDKVKAVNEFPRPNNIDELRRFLGMVNFYRSHIPNAVSSQSILTSFIHGSKKKDKTPIAWTPDAELAFEECKASLCDAVMLSHPVADAPLALMTDSSDTCVGAVLQQRVDNAWLPLGYFSKSLSKTERKYSTYDRELLGIYLAIRHFRNMVEGRMLTVYTDHKPITFAFSKINSEKELPRRTRHLMFISEFTTDIRHVSGQDNVVADTLSRVATISCPTVIDYEELAREQQQDTYILQVLNSDDTDVAVKKIILPGSSSFIFCNISNDRIRPYLPEKFRRIAFDTVHNLSHPGTRTTRKLVQDRFYWPSMNRDVSQWTKTCIQCQRSKVNRHTMSALGSFPQCDRFEHIHVDLVGPLPISQDGFRYCLTIIDRGTRWPECFPTKDITAETVARVIHDNWVCRFGSPRFLTSDQGRQFESNLFSELMKLLGIKKLRTTPYHPQSNGAVERWHRSLKAALTARLCNAPSSWVSELPTVLLGLRTAVRSDNGISAAELTYGTTLRLPADYYDTKSNLNIDSSNEYVWKLRDNIRKFRSMAIRENKNGNIFIHPDLETCSHVFIRNDAVRRPLQPTYDGPFRVLDRNRKVYYIQMSNRKVHISIDRLKPAYCLSERNDESSTTDTEVPNHDSPVTCTTRSGRVTRVPIRFR